MLGEQNEDGFAYMGSMVFSYDDGDWVFDSTPFVGGRIHKSGSSFVADRYATDHLGSVRAVVRSGQVVERNDYYPYGGRHANSALTTDATNRWRFSGKEIQTTASVNLLDFGARMYDDRLCRWTTQDPMSEKYYGYSPYVYCAGEPVGYSDYNGMDRIIKTIDRSKKITATFFVDYSEYNKVTTYSIISDAAQFLNDATGLYYTEDGTEYSVSFDITVSHSHNPQKSAQSIPGANYIRIDESKGYVLIDGRQVVGHGDGGKKVVIQYKQLGNQNIVLHEMLHSLGAAIKKGPNGEDPHEQQGLMTQRKESQTKVITQETIDSIIQNGYVFSEYKTSK